MQKIYRPIFLQWCIMLHLYHEKSKPSVSDQTGNSPKSSKELALALDLLSNFQYEVLSSEVNLDNEGQLLLGLSLAGKNPSQYEGRPINFNI